MSILSRITGDSDNDSKNEQYDCTYDVLVAGEFTAYGAVHASGEVTVEVGTLYKPDGTDEKDNLRIDGSVHSTGYDSVTVHETREVPTGKAIEPSKEGEGFTRYNEGRERFSGAGEPEIFIKELHLLSNPTPRLIKSAGKTHGAYYDEVEALGNVHSPGMLTVEIEELYIHPHPSEE